MLCHFSCPSVMKRKGSPTLTDKIIEMMQQKEQKENGKSQQEIDDYLTVIGKHFYCLIN
jgi:hypothetical protein